MKHQGTRHAFFIGTLIAVSLGFGALIWGFWQPIFWAAVLGILFRPLGKRLMARLGQRKNLAAALTLLVIVATVVIPAMLVTSALATEAAGVYRRVQSGEWNVGSWAVWLQNLMPSVTEWLAGHGVNITELPDRLSDAAVQGSQFVASMALNIGQNAASFFMHFFLMLYLLFFVLRDGDQMMQHLHRGIPLPDELKRRLFGKFAEVSRATVKGTLLVGLIQGSLGGLAFALLGIPSALFWGVIMVILSILPAVGTGLVWVPAAMVLAAGGDWGKAVFLMVFGVLVIGLVDNILRPILVGRDTKMPDYLILLSTLGGLVSVGITGFVLGPVLAAMFLAGWQMFEQDSSSNHNSLQQDLPDTPDS